MPLLEGLDGVEKMSKSKNNFIALEEPANGMFAKVLSISDALMWRWFTLLSFRSEPEIAELRREVDAGRNPKDAKLMLAHEITARFPRRSGGARGQAGFREPRARRRARRDSGSQPDGRAAGHRGAA